jgi:hypothetical protein
MATQKDKLKRQNALIASGIVLSAVSAASALGVIPQPTKEQIELEKIVHVQEIKAEAHRSYRSMEREASYKNSIYMRD